ncbi:hypothetical protein IQ251_18595 [Saccharopolyspora sp. HNM0983]|uniref:Uncharacterized protein n=1 Tax=Saccharopolyspora montiporae TaxID=2781240 RepID=A0A929G328_9PSEU|nr:hypothetical protein [Saccharopolyspora sp. HNM0983]MBE9376463.1 hypothetical protein [Saccharopolyspora sp. HNM0983]
MSWANYTLIPIAAWSILAMIAFSIVELKAIIKLLRMEHNDGANRSGRSRITKEDPRGSGKDKLWLFPFAAAFLVGHLGGQLAGGTALPLFDASLYLAIFMFGAMGTMILIQAITKKIGSLVYIAPIMGITLAFFGGLNLAAATEIF